MKYSAAIISLAALVPVCVRANLMINTVNDIVECEPTSFSWNGGTPPYFLSLVPGTNTGAAALKNFGQQDGTSHTWVVDLSAGTQFTSVLKDNTGATVYSDVQTVESGTNNSCVSTSMNEGGSNSSTGSSAMSSGEASANSSTTSSGTSSGSTSTSMTGSSAGSSASGSVTHTAGTSSSSSSSSSSSGAGHSTSIGSFAAVVLLGLVGVALF